MHVVFCLYTQQSYDIETTSMHRHDVASTLIEHCFNVVCLLGTFSTTVPRAVQTLFLPVTTFKSSALLSAHKAFCSIYCKQYESRSGS